MAAKTLSALFLLVTLAACTAESPTPQTADIANVAPLLMQRSTEYKDIPKSGWPPPIARLNPETVYVAPEGLFIVTKSHFMYERGYFIPRSEPYISLAKVDHLYTAIGHGVYAFKFTGLF